VTPEDVAAELNVLASRVRRMSPPLASNPNRFHEERSDIGQGPRGPRSAGMAPRPAGVRCHGRLQRHPPRADHHHRPDRQRSPHRGAEAQTVRHLRWWRTDEEAL